MTSDQATPGYSKPKLISTDEAYNLDIDTVRAWYKSYVNPGVENILYTFSIGEHLVSRAEGIWFYLKDNGRKIFDATGGLGVLNLGHNHPKILQARIRFQEMQRMEVHKAIFSQYTAALSYNLAEIFNKKLQYSFFCNSGAEAVEGAVKTAYKYHNGERQHILHSDVSYHGKLLGAGSITGSNEVNFKFPTISGTHAFTYNSINSIRKQVAELRTAKNTSDIYAIIVEPFSVSTLTPCSDEFLKELRSICHENDIILIFDEIFSGWYKMGPLFYFFKSGVYPDILTVSKTMGGGKSSISAFISKPEIYQAAYGNITDAFLHSTSYNGFGEECITAIEALNIMFDEDFGEKTKRIESTMNTWLQNLKKKYPDRIVTWAGCGSLFAFQLKIIPIALSQLSKYIPMAFASDGKFIDKIESAAFCDFLFRKYDIHTLFGGQNEINIFFAPAAIVSESDLAETLSKIEDAVEKFSVTDIIGFVSRKGQKSIF